MTAEIFQIKAVLLKCAFVAVSIRERIFKILLGGFGRGDGSPASKKTIYIRDHEKKYSWAYGSLLVELWRFRFFLNLSGNDSRWSSGAFVSGAELFLLPDDLRRSVFSIFGTLRSERMFFPLRRGCARESRQRRQHLRQLPTRTERQRLPLMANTSMYLHLTQGMTRHRRAMLQTNIVQLLTTLCFRSLS